MAVFYQRLGDHLLLVFDVEGTVVRTYEGIVLDDPLFTSGGLAFYLLGRPPDSALTYDERKQAEKELLLPSEAEAARKLRERCKELEKEAKKTEVNPYGPVEDEQKEEAEEEAEKKSKLSDLYKSQATQ